MTDKKILLKLGGRKHLGEVRWKGALTFFDEIFCSCIYDENTLEIEDERIEINELKENFINSFLIDLIRHTRWHRSLNVINWLLIYALRLFNRSWMKKIKKINASAILCSYGDYDRSDLAFLIAKPVINGDVVRSYKEARVKYNFLEYYSFRYASKVNLYDKELKFFLERKYGEDFFEGKQVMLGNDENALPSCVLNGIKYREKISARDGKTHIVILSYRVDSDPNRKRDEGRYYYVDVIRDLIKAGLVVHLHCAKYISSDGKNKYQDLVSEYPGKFYMEPPLSMDRNSSQEEWIEACEILSRYDLGILHNIIEGSSVSEFDRINIPHRFYAYEAAHVIPILKNGENVVLERMFKEYNCGFIYDELKDLSEASNYKYQFYTPSYEEYLKEIFNL